MMKFVKTALLTSALLISSTASAGNHTFVAGDASVETKLCLAAVNNNLAKYRKQVKSFAKDTKITALKHRVVANNLKCNDEKVAIFANNYGADKTSEFIIRHMRKSVSVSREVAVIDRLESNELDKSNVIVVTAN